MTHLKGRRFTVPLLHRMQTSSI